VRTDSVQARPSNTEISCGRRFPASKEVFRGWHVATGTLVLSPDVFADRSGTVIAVSLTSKEPRAGSPLIVESTARGLPKRSSLKVSQIRTLAVERIGRRLARASSKEVSRALDGLDEIIGDS
jgi:mRNA interferase MazF